MSDALLSALKGSEGTIRSILKRKLKIAEEAVVKAEEKAAAAQATVEEKKRAFSEIMEALAQLS